MATTTQPRAFQHGEDKLVQCPFNPAHKVKEGRLDIHVSKCRKGMRRTLLTCRFNKAHLVPADAIHAHLAECPDRDPARPASSNARQAAAAAEADLLYPIRPPKLPEPEECWDKDADNANLAPRPAEAFRATALPPQQQASSRSFKSAPVAAAAVAERLVELVDPPQPKTTIRFLPAPSPPLSSESSDSEIDEVRLAQRLAGLGRGRGRPRM
ncbi:uncharacterized protein LOC144179023 [Haemaphysalis longicornis]